MEQRLQKILSRAGISSRRTAENMIAEGRVSVNNVVVEEPGMKADACRDEIRVDGRLIPSEPENLYLILNKPRGYVTTLSDPLGRPIVTDLLIGIVDRVFPVGRLDYDSEGLIILTNDGDFSQRLQHPRYGIPKKYRVKVSGRFQKKDMRALKDGVVLADGKFVPQNVHIDKNNPKSSWIELTIKEGKNRIIRRVFETMGYTVNRLIRIAVGNVTLDALQTGKWRVLSKAEVDMLSRHPESRNLRKNCLDIHCKINNSRRK